jgi:hypothetical protein
MKRDFDLIRKIMLAVEEQSSEASLQLPDLLEKIPGYDVPSMGYNIDLAVKAGLIEGETHGYPISIALVSGLTWAGHDFLDDARSETVWNESKAKLLKVGGSASLEILKAVLIKTSQSLLGLG